MLTHLSAVLIFFKIRTTTNGQQGADIAAAQTTNTTSGIVSGALAETTTTTAQTAPRPAISALDQAMAATLAAIDVPSPQNGMVLGNIWKK